jgi:hypothetical protein
MKFLEVQGVPFTFAGRTFDLIFNVSVMLKIYEKYNNTETFQKEYNAAISDTKNPTRTVNMLVWIFCLLVNDAIAAENESAKEKTATITEAQALRLLKAKDYQALQGAIISAWNDSMTVAEKSLDEDDDAPTAAELEAEEETEKN